MPSHHDYGIDCETFCGGTPDDLPIKPTIYSRWGSPVTILAYCGKHTPKGFAGPLVLLKVRYEDDGSEGFAFAVFLKADGGVKTIDAAVDAAPEIELGKAELRKAIKQAQ